MASIRLFLTLTLIAIIVLVSFLSSLRGYRQSMTEAETLFDMQLQEHAKLLSLADLNRGRVIEELLLPRQANTQLSTESLIAYQVFDEEGGLLLRSVVAPSEPMSPREVGYSDRNFNGYRWRVLVVREANNGHWVMVAQRLDVRYELAESVILEAVIPTVLGIPLAALLIWFIVGYGLRPIQQLAQEVRSREVSDLSPVRLDNVPRELTPLTVSTNDLLRRLQSSFSREKRFAADAAHELRTPISILKVQVHNLLAEMESPSATLEELRQGIDAMGHLVEQILVLNRTAPDQYMVQFVPIDLYALAQDVISSEYEQILEREQRFDLEGGSAVVAGDATALRSLILNLIGNASKYSPVGAHIRMRVRTDHEEAILQVEDSGPGIPESYRERVFDRFYRLDGDRHASGVSGSGLGLAIVKHIVEMHGGRIRLSESRELGGLCVTIVFKPLAEETTKGMKA
ncbi:MAG: sensor histidine kinase N-terminal domain-containing protein [Pseudomonadales bacterium]|nr:sensor histidine kinase N-terminal domain-containing protein [Pseudomonadales bacterium]